MTDASAPDEASGSEAGGNGWTILLVEDDPVILNLLTVTFELEGYTVIRAIDGAKGWDRFEEASPDVVLSDIMMPNRSGIDLLGDIRSDPQRGRTPVVLLSAKALFGDVRFGLEMGADDYVTKPFEPDDLVARVAKLLPG